MGFAHSAVSSQSTCELDGIVPPRAQMRPGGTGPAPWQGATAEPQFQSKAERGRGQCQQHVGEALDTDGQ